jgi:hypothetical protein
MQGSQEIRLALAGVADLRQAASGTAELPAAILAIKALQARRFAATYTDLLADPMFAPSATFFLEELYSAKDFSERDAQFARIAVALERTFPEAVLSTVRALAQLHLQTEQLDIAMARVWCLSPVATDTARYMNAWRMVGQRTLRAWQLTTVLDIGAALGRLTRKPGLRLTLKMMRKPAQLAGLGALQTFLESGFDHFSGMAKAGAVTEFLDTIRKRESDWINRLFDAEAVSCETALIHALLLVPGTPA